MGPYRSLGTWVDEFIPYYMEIMGVDRPDRLYLPLGGSFQDLYVVNNHGDRMSPKDVGLWDPFQIAYMFMASKLG